MKLGNIREFSKVSGNMVQQRRGVVVALQIAVSAIRDRFPPLCAGKSQWRGFLTMVPSGNTAADISQVKHLTKKIIIIISQLNVYSPCQNRNFRNSGQTLRKSGIEIFWFYPILVDFFTLFQIFCPRLQFPISAN